MRPPLAGKRAAARRLAQEVRRRLPGSQGGDRDQAAPSPAARSEPTPEEAAARIDAARARLKATIEPPAADPDA